MSVLRSLGHLLELANGFVQQPHFTEGDAQVVVSVRVFIRTRAFALKLLLQFAEHVGKINTGTQIMSGRGALHGGNVNGRRFLPNHWSGRTERACTSGNSSSM